MGSQDSPPMSDPPPGLNCSFSELTCLLVGEGCGCMCVCVLLTWLRSDSQVQELQVSWSMKFLLEDVGIVLKRACGSCLYSHSPSLSSTQDCLLICFFLAMFIPTFHLPILCYTSILTLLTSVSQ